MLINFDVNGTSMSVPHNTAIRSEIIKNILCDLKSNDQHDNCTSDTTVYIPEKYFGIIDNYVKFLNTTTTTTTVEQELETVTDSDILIQCFDVSTYFFDTEYFNYLLCQLFGNWISLSSAIYMLIP